MLTIEGVCSCHRVLGGHHIYSLLTAESQRPRLPQMSGWARPSVWPLHDNFVKQANDQTEQPQQLRIHSASTYVSITTGGTRFRLPYWRGPDGSNEGLANEGWCHTKLHLQHLSEGPITLCSTVLPREIMISVPEIGKIWCTILPKICRV